jgi:hypothetical protein
MSTMQSEVFDVFRSVGIDEAKALKAAAALNERDRDVVVMKADIVLLKWMVGFVLAFQVVMVAKLFH